MSDVRYTVLGTRLSGESTTSFINTLVNLLVQEFVYHEHHANYNIIPSGDDSITGLSIQIPIAQLRQDFS